MLTLTILAAITFITQPPMPPAGADSNVELHEKISMHDDGTEIGFLNWNGYYSDPTVAGIYSLYLKPEFRRKGYGKQLLKHTIDIIANRGYSSILLVPGAMEMEDGKLIDLKGEQLEKLLPERIRFYSGIGFGPDPGNAKQLIYYVGRTASTKTESLPSLPNSCATSIGIVTLIVFAIALVWWWRRRKR